MPASCKSTASIHGAAEANRESRKPPHDKQEGQIINITINPLLPEERLYSYPQSDQLALQTGCVGLMTVNAETGKTSWTTDYTALYTDDFKADFDLVQKVFHFNDPQTSFIHDRDTLLSLCQSLADSSFGNGKDYGFRIDTEQYSYLMRHEIGADSTDTCIYAYRREHLDRHMDKAKSGIRFIKSNYDPLFTIPDGGSIRIRYPDGERKDKVCRYIDDTHFETEHRIYHICEFAEIMEKAGNTVEAGAPLTPKEFEEIWSRRKSKAKPKQNTTHKNNHFR